MADGSVMRARSDPGPVRLTLDEAISRLEAGKGEGVVVDLGEGRTAVADGHRGDDGLLQRLRGHRMLVALASGAADLSQFSTSPGTVNVAPLVQEILDAAVQRD
ncbi:hypothetical protein [Hyphomonas johnsonii]|uniref:Uncharacterized protein n=1 Tax=Hyphomonas johnsonii MHS-2 TaxID=1280950 RepID=A0A059FJQ5_9PROT|nr:hypothetical protein [Hyphomonas johnsonii]KCZ90766.1 hypothetical protein HJO_12981 [Hyphomonas johnsonii MHS-2]